MTVDKKIVMWISIHSEYFALLIETQIKECDYSESKAQVLDNQGEAYKPVLYVTLLKLAW